LTVAAILLTASVVFAEPRAETFGGFGFQNAEANLVPLMTDVFRDERVLKTFAEIAPSMARVYAGFADCPKEQADRFADYYDHTFRRAGTEIYAVGGQMPWVDPADADAYAEKVAQNLAYLVKVRQCTGIRRYCLTNELGVENRGDWFVRHMEDFRIFHAALRRAFDRHGLASVGLAATDVNNHVGFSLKQLDWATKNMDDITESYVTHWYMFMGRTGDRLIVPSSPENAAVIDNHFAKLVAKAAERGKRYFLGEFGLWTPPKTAANRVMHDDTNYSLREPTLAAEGALTLAEIALSAMNAGAYAAVSWSFCDYPDPFVYEPGDTPEEEAVYQSARCTVWPDRKYNKWGLFRWSSVDRDYRAYPQLYTLGLLARFFRGGSHVLPRTVDDAALRVGGVVNSDGSLALAVVNWGAARELRLKVPSGLVARSLRVYEYDSARPPFNACNDLQSAKGTVATLGGVVTVTLPAKSMTVLTTDYVDRVPGKVGGVRRSSERLVWDAIADPDHRYYRVYRDGRHVVSTVATALAVSPKGTYRVVSVDRWGNEGL